MRDLFLFKKNNIIRVISRCGAVGKAHNTYETKDKKKSQLMPLYPRCPLHCVIIL